MNYLREMADQGYNSETIGPFHEFMIPWLFSLNKVQKGGSVVDIGAGQGHCLIPLHRNGWTNLVAVDVDDYNFELFQSKYGINSFRCDFNSQPLKLEDGSVDAVVCFHLIEHLSKPDNLLIEAHRVLKKGGKLFLVTPDWRKQYKTFWRDPTHIRPYDKESIARLLRIHNFSPTVHSWGSAYGLGRLQAYRWIPRLGMIGQDLLAVGTKL
jgi:2-polyprenyl-3-methyl-5-hydroxy-6-metoxy-1,4-benzoquinol methylase